MSWEEGWSKIENWEQNASEEDKVKLAAQILNEVDPTGDNLKMFFEELDDNVHDELLNRAEMRDSRYS